MKKKLALVLTVVSVGLFLIACEGDSQQGADSEGGRDYVIAAQASEAISVDIHGTNDIPSAQIHRHIFETLIFQDVDMNLHPGLATSWELIDDRVWEFTLREGVYFHNGDYFTAEDVAFTFTRAAQSPAIGPILGMIDVSTIEVVDTYVVRLGTYEPFAPFLFNLAHAASGIMNERAVEEAGDQVGREPVGTGPFTLYEWTPNQQAVLVRFEDYHGEIRPIPTMNRIVIRQIPEASSRLIELETGGIDIDLNPVPDNFSRIEELGEFNIVTIPGLRTEYIALNHRHEHLGDRRVRQAINYAVDVDAIIQAVYNGHGTTGASVISENIFAHNPAIEPYPFDLDRARELMAEAGLETGFSANIYANSERQDRVDIVTIIANQLAEINIELNIVTMDWPSLLEYIDGGEAPMFALGWTATTGDADIALFPLFHTSQIGPAGNRTAFSHPRVDELLEIGRANSDVDIRKEAYFEIQEILREEAPWLITVQETPTVVVRDSIQGFAVDPVQSNYLGDLTFSE